MSGDGTMTDRSRMRRPESSRDKTDSISDKQEYIPELTEKISHQQSRSGSLLTSEPEKPRLKRALKARHVNRVNSKLFNYIYTHFSFILS